MKISLRKKNHGIAVIIALIAITVLSIMAAAFALSMKVETTLAANANNDEKMLWLGRSGVEYARWILVQQASIGAEPYDALNQKWAGGTGSLLESNSVLSGISLDNVPVGEGTISVKITDLERKININNAPAPVLQQVLTSMDVDASRISVVSDSIQDWIDPDDSPRLAGAESDYYQTLNPPYYAKNAPIDDISELLMIKGVTWAMYSGGSETNSGPVFQHKLGFGNSPGSEESYSFGLTNVFTAVSSGQININTADANVLAQLFPGGDLQSAQDIVKFRAGPDGVEGNEDDTPFRNVGQLSAAGVSPQAVQQLSQLCTVRSTTFEVTITASVGPQTRVFHAILLRTNGANVQVVGFYWD